MIELYKKVDGEKVKVNNLLEIEKPFFICLDEDSDIVNFSITSEDKEKIDIIGIDYQYEEDKIASRKDEILNSVILPFIENNKTNRLNIITSGNNTNVYNYIESKLEDSTDLSKISLISLSSKTDTSGLKANTVTFVDVNDKTTETEFTNDYKNALKEADKNKLSGHYGRNNNIICVYNGTGNNDIKEYLNDIGFKSIISYILEKTSKNEDINSDEILNILENNSNEVNYNISYVKPKQEIDIALETTNEVIRLYKNEEKERIRLQEQLNKLIASIKEYSSDTTYNQILMASGILGFEDPNFLNAMSDKQARTFYDEIMREVDEDEKKNTK